MDNPSHPIWTKNFILLCLANITTFISMQMLLPTMPMYLLHIGGTQLDVGYVMSAYTLGAMLMRAAAGWLVDRYARKTVLLVGLVLMLATTLVYVMATNVLFMAGIRLLHGLTFGLVGTAIGTMAADDLPMARLGEGLGYFGLSVNLSMAFAPMLGLWLTGAYSYHVLFFTMSALVFLSFLIAVPVRNTHVPTSRTASSAIAVLAGLLEKTAVLPSLVVFFLTTVFGAVLFFIALYAAKLGIADTGLFFMAMSLFMLLSRPISGRWSDRGGMNAVMFLGHLALCLGIILIAFSRGITALLSAGVLLGIGFGFCFPVLQAQAVRFASAERRGAATGTFFFAFDIGIGSGGIIWGYIAEAGGYQIMYFATLVPIAVAGLIYHLFKSKMVLEK